MQNNPPIPPPLGGKDALVILRIVWGWIEGANDGTGSDIGDLMHELTAHGYDPEWIEGS